jgi:hypothetical protein
MTRDGNGFQGLGRRSRSVEKPGGMASTYYEGKLLQYELVNLSLYH